jgi:hypothetical protein
VRRKDEASGATLSFLQADLRDFAVCTKAETRSPIARALIHIQLQILNVIKALAVFLEKADQQIPWEELSTVGVTREL